MNLEMKLYWEAFNALVTTKEIIDHDFNPIYHYREEMIGGAIVDIGCGQNSALPKFAKEDQRRLIALDNDT